MDMDFAFWRTLVHPHPCALLALHLHQVVQGTFTP